MNGHRTEAVVLNIRVTDAASINTELDAADAVAQDLALHNPSRPGILITRRSADSFTIALTTEVPFGLTQEKQDW